MCWTRILRHIILYAAYLAPAFFAMGAADCGEPIFFDSFSGSGNNWVELAGYHSKSQANQSLEAFGRSDKGYQLKHPLPLNADVRFFFKMPALDACAGFILANETRPTGERVYFSITGKKSENPKKGVLCERVINGQVTPVFTSATEVQDSDWHVLEVKRDYVQIHVSLDGKSVGSFKFLDDVVHMSLWSNSFGKVLFDEFQVTLAKYFSRDFPASAYKVVEGMPNWTIQTGLWTRLYMPSQKGVVLHQSLPGDSRILLNTPCPDDFVFKCRVKTEDNGQAGFILDQVSDSEYLLLSLDVNEKSNLELTAHTGAKLAKPLEKLAVPLYRGIWYDVQITKANGHYILAIDEREILQFKAPTGKGGRMGLFTSGTATGVFMDPLVIASGQERATIHGNGSLYASQVSSSDWESGFNLQARHEPGQSAKMVMTPLLGLEGSVKGFLRPGDDFERFTLHLAGAVGAYEFQLVKDANGQFHSIVLQGGKSATPPGNSPIPVKIAHRDQRNQQYQELNSQPLPPFDPQWGVSFAIGLDKNSSMVVHVNNKLVSSHVNKVGDKDFTLEFNCKGAAAVHNFEFTPTKDRQSTSLFAKANEELFSTKSGTWTIKGGKIDSDSMKKTGAVVTFKKPLLQHASYALLLNRGKDGGVIKLRLDDPEQNKTQDEITLNMNAIDEIQIAHHDERGKTTNQTWKISYPVQVTTLLHGSQIRWLLGDRFIGESRADSSASSQLSLVYLQGQFSLQGLTMTQFPDFTSLFNNPQRFVEDAAKWTNNNLLVPAANYHAGLPGAMFGAYSFPQKNGGTPITLTLVQPFSQTYAFSLDLDFGGSRETMKCEILLQEPDLTSKIFFDVGKTDCRVSLASGESEKMVKSFPSKRLTLLVQRGATEGRVTINGGLLGQFSAAKQGPASLSLVLSNYNQQNLRISNAIFFSSP